MNIFDGVVAVADDKVPVIVDISDSLRLSANGTEIGSWNPGEFLIADNGDGAYTISAEHETLTFIPNQPELFAAWVTPAGRHESSISASLPVKPGTIQAGEALASGSPLPPMARTFYLMLMAATVAIGIWAFYTVLT